MTPDRMLAALQTPENVAAARDFLSAALRLDALIAVKLARLDMLRDRAQRMGRALDGLPGGSGTGDRVGNAAAELADMEEDVRRDYAALLRRQKRIGAVIRAVPDEIQSAVLEMRYLQGMPFHRIAAALHYDERQIYRFHQRGVGHVAVQLALAPPEEGEDACSA